MKSYLFCFYRKVYLSWTGVFIGDFKDSEWENSNIFIAFSNENKTKKQREKIKIFYYIFD